MRHVKLTPLVVTISKVSAMKKGTGAFPAKLKAPKPLDPAVEKALKERLAALTGKTVAAIDETKRKERVKKGYGSLEEAMKQMKQDIKK